MSKMIASFLIVSLLVSGCATLPAQETYPAEAPEQPAQGTSPGQAPDQPQPAQTEAPLPPVEQSPDKPSVELPEGAVLEFHRSGGFAGLDEVWTLYADGRLTRADSSRADAIQVEWQASPEQVTALLDRLAGLDFFSLPAGSETGMVGADRFTYSLTLDLNGQSHTVSAAEGAKGASEALWQAIAEVQSFLDEVAKSAPAPLE